MVTIVKIYATNSFVPPSQNEQKGPTHESPHVGGIASRPEDKNILWPKFRGLNFDVLNKDSHSFVPKKNVAQLLEKQQTHNTVTAQLWGGTREALEDQFTHVVQSGYGLFNGLLSGVPNRQIGRLGSLAPDWLRDLAKTNQEQEAANGRAAMAALAQVPDKAAQVVYSKLNVAGLLDYLILRAGDDMPPSIQKLAVNDLGERQKTVAEMAQQVGRVLNGEMWGELSSISPWNAGYSLTNAVMASVRRNSSGVGITPPKSSTLDPVKPIALNSKQRINQLATLFWRKDSSEGSTLTYGSRNANSWFEATVKNGTLEFDFSTLRARKLSGSPDNGPVSHHYSNTDLVQGPGKDGRFVSVNTSGEANKIQAELLTAAIRRLSHDDTPVKNVKVKLDALRDNDPQTAKRIGVLKANSDTSKELEDGIWQTALGRAMRSNKFDRVEVFVDENHGGVKGLIFSLSGREK